MKHIHIALVLLVLTFIISSCAKSTLVYRRYHRKRPSIRKAHKNVVEVIEVFKTNLRPPAFHKSDQSIEKFLLCDAKCVQKRLQKRRRLCVITGRYCPTRSSKSKTKPTTQINVSTRPIYQKPTIYDKNPFVNVNPDYTHLYPWSRPSVTVTKYPPDGSKDFNMTIVEVNNDTVTATKEDYEYYDIDNDDRNQHRRSTTFRVPTSTWRLINPKISTTSVSPSSISVTSEAPNNFSSNLLITELTTTKQSTTVHSTTEQLIAVESTTVPSTTELYTTEISSTELSTTELSTTELSTSDISTTDLSTTDLSTTELSTTEQSTTAQLLTEGHTFEKTTIEQPVTEQPANEQSTTWQSTTEQSRSELSATELSQIKEWTTPITQKSINRFEQTTSGVLPFPPTIAASKPFITFPNIIAPTTAKQTESTMQILPMGTTTISTTSDIPTMQTQPSSKLSTTTSNIIETNSPINQTDVMNGGEEAEYEEYEEGEGDEEGGEDENGEVDAEGNGNDVYDYDDDGNYNDEDQTE